MKWNIKNYFLENEVRKKIINYIESFNVKLTVHKSKDKL